MYRAFYSSSDLLFVAQLYNVGGNFLFNTAGNIDVRLSICPVCVRYNYTVQHVGDCVICLLEIGRIIWKVPFFLDAEEQISRFLGYLSNLAKI